MTQGLVLLLSCFIGIGKYFTCRRMQWVQHINVAYIKNSQAICEEHFDDRYHGSMRRLLSNAFLRLTGKTGILCVYLLSCIMQGSSEAHSVLSPYLHIS